MSPKQLRTAAAVFAAALVAVIVLVILVWTRIDSSQSSVVNSQRYQAAIQAQLKHTQEQLAVEQRGLAAEQHALIDAHYEACSDTNRRNAHTIDVLDRLIRARVHPRTAVQRRQLARARASTLAIINALEPLHTCHKP